MFFKTHVYTVYLFVFTGKNSEMVQFDDAQHFLLISLPTISFPLYLSVVFSEDVKALKTLYGPCILSLFVVLSYTLLMALPITSGTFDTSFDRMSWTLICLAIFWFLMLRAAIQLGTDYTYLIIGLVIAPAIYVHESEVISVWLEYMTGRSIASWVGYVIMTLVFIAGGVVLYFIGIRGSTVQMAIRMLVVSYFCLSGTMVLILEGPAPDFSDTFLVCFESVDATRCPLGLNDWFTTVVFVVVLTAAVSWYWRVSLFWICCKRYRDSAIEQNVLASRFFRKRKLKQAGWNPLPQVENVESTKNTQVVQPLPDGVFV